MPEKATDAFFNVSDGKDKSKKEQIIEEIKCYTVKEMETGNME